MATTKIEWTDSTWNPVTGCTPISEGCDHCYAKRMANRLAGRYGYPKDDPFRVTFHPDRLDRPLRWKNPRRIFVGSMTDLFHPDVTLEWLGKILCITERCPQHTFMFLTKRPELVEYYLFPGRHNCWLGVTAENQARADERIPILLQIPAAVRFVSLEPLLGQIDLRRAFGSEGARQTYIEQFDWVIAGGETSHGARPMHPNWVRSLRDQCQATGVPFFFKSWGDWVAPSQYSFPVGGPCLESVKRHVFADGIEVYRVGKKAAGRLLDGKEHNEFPA